MVNLFARMDARILLVQNGWYARMAKSNVGMDIAQPMWITAQIRPQDVHFTCRLDAPTVLNA